MFKWVCSKCGYEKEVQKPEEIDKYITPDGKCPKCGAPHTEFKLLHTETPLT